MWWLRGFMWLSAVAGYQRHEYGNAMNRDDLKWLDISDFTPGIHEIYNPQMPPGTALNTTYGCWASVRHGLTGLPSRDLNYTPVDNPVYLDGAQRQYKIVGFLIVPAVHSTNNNDYTAGAGHTAVVIPDADDSVAANHSVAAYITYEAVNDIFGPVQRYNITMIVGLAASSVSPPETSLVSQTTVDTITELDDVAHTYMQFGRSVGDHTVALSRSPLQPGSPVIVICALGLNAPGEYINSGGLYLIMTPDPTLLPNAFSPTTLDFSPSGTVTAAMPYGRVLIHQGRILSAIWDYWGRYDDSGVADGVGITSNDIIYWTESNAVNADFQGVFGDKPYGFGVWASLTSSDLFIVTHNNGAILIQGDLNAPVVRRYPGVMPTNGIECDGATTPIGFVYGVGGGGVYAWQGADTSKLLSPQLSNQFWVDPSANRHRAHKGTFANWSDLLLVPGDWCMDYDTGSWWRLTNDDNPTINWQVSPSGAWAYGTPAELLNNAGNNGTAIYGFNKFNRQSTWTWDSHPFITTAWRTVDIQALVLMCIASEVTVYNVTVYDEDTGASKVTTFTHSGDGRMKALKMDCALKTYNLKARITQVSGDGEVHGLRVGYIEREHQRKGA